VSAHNRNGKEAGSFFSLKWSRVIVREIVASRPGQSLGDRWLWGLCEVP